MTFRGRQMRSTMDEHGTLTLSLEDVSTGKLGDDELIVRVEASPINPSDVGLLLGSADLATLAAPRGDNHPLLTLAVPKAKIEGERKRLGQSLPIGNEGAGTVVAAGRNASVFEGKLVGMAGGSMYADYRRIRAQDVMLLPAGATASDGASMFINPLTALGFVETARSEGHKAIIHTAAASNLGQMLQKICLADGIPLINVVRSQEQINALRAIGATHVLNSTAPDFNARLSAVVEELGATIAFDPIGGGKLGSEIISAMERAAVRRMTGYSRYGSDVLKQLYIYGALDVAPITLDRLSFGYQWSVSGWLVHTFLRKAGREVEERLRKRVFSELTTTFASHYTRVIGLAEALNSEILRAYQRKATGEKFLINPTLG